MSLICERKAVQARMDEEGTSLFALASDLRLNLADLKKWLRNGKGLPTKDVDRLLEWAEPKPELSALPLAALNQIATNDALERAVGLTGDTLPETPATSEKWVEERQLVREAMESRSVSQAGVAQAAGVHSTSLCTWLKRGERLAPDKVERLISWAKSPWDPDPLPPVAECYPVDPTGHNVKAHREWQTSNTQIVVGPPPPIVPTVPTAPVSAPPQLTEPAESITVVPERSPAEFLLLSLLEQDAQRHLQDIAGELAARVSVRVVLDWR